MTDLVLTGLRRQVLDQIDACEVWLWVAPNRQRTAYLLDNPTGPDRNRTAAVAWLITAGLVNPPEQMETIRHTIRWSCDERTEVRDQRRTTPTPDDCWISPDEELEFEEIVGPLRPGQVPPC